MSVLQDDLFEPTACILGVIGSSNKMTSEEIQDYVLAPMLQEMGRMPDRILLPTEGHSSLFIQEWAEALHTKTRLFHCDWSRNGKMAQILRDDGIQKECTHALIFLPPRSTRLERLGERMAKKGKIVFTWSCNQTMTMIERQPSALPVSERVRKSGTQKAPPRR